MCAHCRRPSPGALSHPQRFCSQGHLQRTSSATHCPVSLAALHPPSSLQCAGGSDTARGRGGEPPRGQPCSRRSREQWHRRLCESPLSRPRAGCLRPAGQHRDLRPTRHARRSAAVPAAAAALQSARVHGLHGAQHGRACSADPGGGGPLLAVQGGAWAARSTRLSGPAALGRHRMRWLPADCRCLRVVAACGSIAGVSSVAVCGGIAAPQHTCVWYSRAPLHSRAI